MRRKLSSLKQSERVRLIGMLVLVLGVAGACVFYWIQTHNAPPSLDDLLPNSARERQRNMGIMMGPLGVMMLGWTQALQSPATQAIIIAAVSACVALVCRRVASVMDHDEQARARQGGKPESPR